MQHRHIRDALKAVKAKDLPLSALPQNSVFDVPVSVSWMEALTYMIERRISAVPVRQDGKYVGYIDRFTFVHWAAQFMSAVVRRAEELKEPCPSELEICQRIFQVFTTHPLTKLDASCLHPMCMLNEKCSALDVAKALCSGIYRVYLTADRAIASPPSSTIGNAPDKPQPEDVPGASQPFTGVITQTQFFAWLLSQPFVTEDPGVRELTVRDLVDLTPEETKAKDNYAAVDTDTRSCFALCALRRNPTDTQLKSGCIITGEGGQLVTVLRRRDVDILARIGELEILGKPIRQLVALVRAQEAETIATSVLVEGDAPVLVAAKRMSQARFEQCFLLRDGPEGAHSEGDHPNLKRWEDVEDVVTDGRIMRFLLSH